MIRTAVQQIMLGSVTENEKAAAETLRRIKTAGYDGIELNGFMIRPTGFLVRILTKAAGMPAGKGGKLDWQALVKEAGLSVVSIHEDLGTLKREPEKAIREAEAFVTDKIVITGMYRFDYSSTEALDRLCSDLNACGKRLLEAGISLLYHNHNIELVRLPDGKTAYEHILEGTDPAYVNFEFDSYWFTDGGADAASWMEKLGSRMKLWHVTDRGFRLEKTPMTPIVKADSMECGYGSMPLEKLAEAAKKNGIEAAVLESHRNWAEGSPLCSLERSAAFLNREFH